MDYKNFDIEDFLANEEFVRWVTDPTKDLDIFWNKWLEAHPDKKEDALRAKELLTGLKFKVTPTNKDQYNRVLHKILEEQYSKSNNKKYYYQIDNRQKKRFSINAFVRIAAAILILITSGLVWYFKFGPLAPSYKENVELITKANPKGQKSTFALPDGTIVSLNADSKITYPSQFADVRNVELEGEAFFEVSKNIYLPFVVKSGEITTTALGTSFNVKAYEEEPDISVSLKTGKVVVKHDQPDNNEQAYLIPGEKVMYDELSQMISKTSLTNDDFAWKEGVLVFEKTKLKDFIKTIERWYGVKVEVRGNPVEEWFVNGRFKNETLEMVLESISYAENIEYKLEEDNVVLIFKN